MARREELAGEKGTALLGVTGTCLAARWFLKVYKSVDAGFFFCG